MFNRSILKSFGVAFLCLSLTPTLPVAKAAVDVLETPAMQSELASERLLTDITRAGDRLVAVGARGHILYSDDEGKTWDQAKVPVSTLLTAVNFGDARNGWAVGHGAVVLHTSDGGETWQKQFDGYKASDLTVAQLEDQIAAVEERLAGAPEEAVEDLEFRLEELTFNLEDTRYDAEVGPWKPLLDVWFGNRQQGFAIGSYGYIFRTTDGGKTWLSLNEDLDNPNRSHLNAITQVAGGALFIVGEYGLIFRSSDSGATWERLESPYDGSFFGVTGTGNEEEVVVFGLRGNVYRSTDLGQSWQPVDMPERQTLMGAGQGKGEKLVLVGNNGLVSVSNDAGESFRTYTRPDRESLMGVVIRQDGKMVLVGETGAVVANSKGLNVESKGQ